LDSVSTKDVCTFPAGGTLKVDFRLSLLLIRDVFRGELLLLRGHDVLGFLGSGTHFVQIGAKKATNGTALGA